MKEVELHETNVLTTMDAYVALADLILKKSTVKSERILFMSTM